jgi:hypothetical protein
VGGGGGSTTANVCTPNANKKPQDPSKLMACCANPDPTLANTAHCTAAANVPTAIQSQLLACPNNAGFCVPDPFLEEGGLFALKVCTTSLKSPGRCVSKCLPPVATPGAIAILKQDVCQSYEVCAPLTNPLMGNAPTHLDDADACGPPVNYTGPH